MIKKPSREAGRKKRHERVRTKIAGTAERPRLAVFRSNDHIYAQVIDDDAQHTLCAASTVEKEIKSKLENTANVDAAKVVGEVLAKKALAKGIQSVIFDRGGYLYHGKVKALADAAREAGLQF
ncbi:MAG: 50S ribosomal protein L18 [Defluviitaleaceae bacterium]|nr:50S ribosomal protein L18 [Defluviitaleaceae bacterium]